MMDTYLTGHRIRQRGARPDILATLRGTHMTTTFQTKLAQETYNGWSNYETWNVALWIGNDEGLYNIAKEAGNYEAFAEFMIDLFGNTCTPDGILWNDPELNGIELNDMIAEF